MGRQQVAVLLNGEVSGFATVGGFIAVARLVVEGQGRDAPLGPARSVSLHLVQDGFAGSA